MISFDFLSEPVFLKENKIQLLCIENKKLFRDVYSAFVNNEFEENNIVFSENFIPFKSSDIVFVIDDFFRLSYPSSLIKKIYDKIEKEQSIVCSNEMTEIKMYMIRYIETIVAEYDYDFEFSYNVNIADVFKIMDLKPHLEKNDVLGNLIEYIQIVNKYITPKCFVLVNLHLYFSQSEVDLFYNDIINKHIPLLVIENEKNFSKSQYEDIIIYDNDLCEIVEK